MNNNQDENELNKQLSSKKARKEDTRVSLTFILIIILLLMAVLFYIFFKPHQPSPAINSPAAQSPPSATSS